MTKKMISLFLAIFMLCAVIPFSSIQAFALDLPSATGFENAEPIELDETKTITITEPGTTVLLKFTAPADDEYVLAANNKGCMITMYNSNYTCIGGHYGDDAAMIKNMKAGETVYYDCGFWNEYNYGSFTVSMLIRPKATSMKIKSWYNELNRFIGSKDSLNVVFTPSYAKTEEVTWKSKNPDIVSIDKYGRYECKAEGRTTITATSESGLKCSIQINVKEYETISPGETKTVEIINDNASKTFMITPDKDGTYTFRSNSTKRVKALLLDESWDRLAYDDCTGYINGDGINYNLSCFLEAGKTYYFSTHLYRGTGTFEVTAEYSPLYITDLQVLSAPDITTYNGRTNVFPNCDGLSLRTVWSDGGTVDWTYDGSTASIRGYNVNLKYRTDLNDPDYNDLYNIYITVSCAGKTVHTLLSNSAYPDAIATGITGDCTWVLEDNGTLTIYGNGRMQSYFNDYMGPPWAKYRNDIKSIVIQSGVTYVGDDSFTGCNNIESITVSPDNPYYDSRDNCNAIIKTDSNQLIFGCQNTVIPDTVTSIGTSDNYCSAFVAPGLTNITIPEGVTTINHHSFSNCGLSCVTIPASVDLIGADAFTDCKSLKCILISGSNTKLEAKAFGYNIYNKKTDGVVIYGSEGSDAQRYANENGFRFVILENIENIKVGDVNGDKSIDILDSSEIQKNAVGKAEFDNNMNYSADVNGDNVVDILDATAIQKYSTNRIERFKK